MCSGGWRDAGSSTLRNGRRSRARTRGCILNHWAGRTHWWAHHGSCRRIAGGVFANNFLKSQSENLPWKNLDIFLDVSGLWVWERHDELEEWFAIGLSLGDGQRMEPLEISPDPVLLFDGEPNTDESFKKVDAVDTGDECLLSLRPPDTADADAVCLAFARADRCEASLDCVASLSATELNQSTLVLPLFSSPVLGHRVQVSLESEVGLLWELVWVERSM